MHIGMHWYSLWNRLRKLPVISPLAVRPGLCSWLLVLIGWTGCVLARLDHVGDRLLMKHIFGTLAAQLPTGAYHVMLLCMMGIYAIGFFYLQKYLQRKLLSAKGGADR